MRLAALCLVAFPLAAQTPGLSNKAKDLAFNKKVAEAQALAEAERSLRQPDDPELLSALSWVARGAALTEDWAIAEGYARETHEIASRLAARDGVDSSPALATALGASIEVLGAVYKAAGESPKAVEFLEGERQKYRGSSIEARTQKNVLAASLEGTPMPELEPERHLGQTPPAATDGKVAVYYFWAHWCRSSKRQKTDLITLHERYGPQGLAVVGPTTLFGYKKNPGDKATPEEEIAYIEGPWQTENPLPDWMSKPLRTDFFIEFGVSTTPTIVITDRNGIVRLYHPGLMTLQELESAVKPLL